MSQIKINYEAVYNKTRELSNRLQNEIRDMDSNYRHIQAGLQQMDSRTNAVLMEAVVENQNKARVTAESLQRLLVFIENATREVELEEQELTRMYNAGMQNRAINEIGGAN